MKIKDKLFSRITFLSRLEGISITGLCASISTGLVVESKAYVGIIVFIPTLLYSIYSLEKLRGEVVEGYSN